MTTDELNKQASRIQARKKQGFITHLKATGKTDQQVAALLPKYAQLDEKRTRNLTAIRAAIIPNAA